MTLLQKLHIDSEGGGLDIVFEGVEKSYQDATAVRDITFSVPAGETVALLGPNGAGKTTLFKLALGLIKPSEGLVRVDGVEPDSKSFYGVRSYIGYLPENVVFYDSLTGQEVLEYYARLKKVPVSKCAALLERVGLGEAGFKRVRTYSKGMRQRLGLAQCLLGSPKLLILDEPTTGLDPALREKFFDILDQLRADGATILISSHSLTEIEAHSDRYAVMKKGRLIVYGSLDALKRRAKLPMSVRISVSPGKVGAVAENLGGDITLEQANDKYVKISFIEKDKITLIRKIAALDITVEDVDISTPGLSELYAHFTNEEHDR